MTVAWQPVEELLHLRGRQSVSGVPSCIASVRAKAPSIIIIIIIVIIIILIISIILIIIMLSPSSIG